MLLSLSPKHQTIAPMNHCVSDIPSHDPPSAVLAPFIPKRFDEKTPATRYTLPMNLSHFFISTGLENCFELTFVVRIPRPRHDVMVNNTMMTLRTTEICPVLTPKWYP